MSDLFDIDSVMLDVDAIEQGRWVALGADFPGVEIDVRGLSSTMAKNHRQMLERRATRADMLSNGRLSTEAQDRILKETVIEHCVKNWRGLASGGKPLAFSKETLRSFLFEEKARKIANAIINAITDLETKTVDNAKAVEKN